MTADLPLDDSGTPPASGVRFLLVTLVKTMRNQLRNLRRVLRGRPLTTLSLGSMTLALDDVRLARRLLRDADSGEDAGKTAEYEKRFAEWNGSKHAYAFMGGRVALSACLHGLGLQSGDEVILPGYTCVVVHNALTYAGVVPVYVDIELETYGIDAGRVKEKITPRTRAILLQHLYGLVCRDYEELLKIAKAHNLPVIEDCAHATGAEYQGKKVGTRGDVGFYSSEQSKVFSTGRGGMAVTDDDRISERIREYYDAAPLPSQEETRRQLASLVLNYYQLSAPGRWWKGDVAELLYGRKRVVSTSAEEEAGIRPPDYGCRMPSAVAEIALNQLSKIDRFNQARRVVAKRWDAWCEQHGYAKPLVVSGSVPVFLRYPVLVEETRKADTSWAYEELGVQLGVWFVSNLHPAKVKLEGCPNAEVAISRCINFPCLEP